MFFTTNYFTSAEHMLEQRCRMSRTEIIHNVVIAPLRVDQACLSISNDRISTSTIVILDNISVNPGRQYGYVDAEIYGGPPPLEHADITAVLPKMPCKLYPFLYTPIKYIESN